MQQVGAACRVQTVQVPAQLANVRLRRACVDRRCPQASAIWRTSALPARRRRLFVRRHSLMAAASDAAAAASDAAAKAATAAAAGGP